MWKNICLVIWLNCCVKTVAKNKTKLDNLTIADQSDCVLEIQGIITQNTAGVVITVLKPLQI